MLRGDEKIYSVTAVTKLIKYTLEESFPSVWVEGEISNYIHHSSGHRYLTLKDDNATIKLTIWRSAGGHLKFEPENGMKVRAFGSISVYEKAGSYQLNTRKLVPVGVGELEIAFRQLYEKLSGEGLFEKSRQQPLPEYPKKIGIVTSPTGAAIRDIINIARRRNDSVQLVLYPAQVQGDGAELSIIAGIEYFDNRDDIDLIIIGRGGGSLEDLWAFNTEPLIRAMVACGIPIVSAVGHEIDTTLSDLVADLRAPTPSAAAELVVWDKKEYLDRVFDNLNNMEHFLRSQIASNLEKVRQISDRPVFRRPENYINEKAQRLDSLIRLLDIGGKNLLEKKKNLLSLLGSRLESLSPRAILKRGYAVLTNMATGAPIISVDELGPEMLIEATIFDGKVTASVTDIKKDEQ